MQGLITLVLFLSFVSQCLCVRWNVGTTNTNNVHNVMSYGAVGDGKTDDSLAFSKAWQSTCATQGTATLVIPTKYVFLVQNLMLNGPCMATSIQIQLQGHIVAPTKDAWRGEKDTLISISKVKGLTVDGNGGLIDGNGADWWNCKTCPRPTVILFNACNNLVVKFLKVTNSPQAHVKINHCNGAMFSDLNIQAPHSSPNTDGIDIGDSTNILIYDSKIATGDDCIAILGGSSNVNATKITCGPGHGISIGSLGRGRPNDTVEEVYVQNCTFIGTTNGARIKTFQGGSGYARNITFEQIILQNCANPIIINQQYHQDNTIPEKGVSVSEITYRGFEGTSANDKAIDLNCSPFGCFNITLDRINIVSSIPGEPANAQCTNAHGRATSTIPKVTCIMP